MIKYLWLVFWTRFCNYSFIIVVKCIRFGPLLAMILLWVLFLRHGNDLAKLVLLDSAIDIFWSQWVSLWFIRIHLILTSHSPHIWNSSLSFLQWLLPTSSHHPIVINDFLTCLNGFLRMSRHELLVWSGTRNITHVKTIILAFARWISKIRFIDIIASSEHDFFLKIYF